MTRSVPGADSDRVAIHPTVDMTNASPGRYRSRF